MMVTIGDSKSQIQNREKARAVLRSRLYQIEMDKQQAELTNARLDQMGSGDRSEKIRTYNYPQGRVTDHRIGLTLYHLDAVVGGDVDMVIDKLKMEDQANKLAEMDGL